MKGGQPIYENVPGLHTRPRAVRDVFLLSLSTALAGWHMLAQRVVGLPPRPKIVHLLLYRASPRQG